MRLPQARDACFGMKHRLDCPCLKTQSPLFAPLLHRLLALRGQQPVLGQLPSFLTEQRPLRMVKEGRDIVLQPPRPDGDLRGDPGCVGAVGIDGVPAEIREDTDATCTD